MAPLTVSSWNGSRPMLPELNSGEGLWTHSKGVERCYQCCVNLPHLRAERRDAVKQVRRKPRLIHGVFRGAKLEVLAHV